MPAQNNTPGVFKAMQLLHRALLLGQALFAMLAFYLVYSGKFEANLKNLDQVLQLIAILFSVAGFFGGSKLFKNKILEIRESAVSAKSKIDAYRIAAIIQWALLEGPSLFAIICFLITGNYAFLALSFALILVFAILAPTKIKISILLNIKEDDIDRL